MYCLRCTDTGSGSSSGFFFAVLQVRVVCIRCSFCPRGAQPRLKQTAGRDSHFLPFLSSALTRRNVFRAKPARGSNRVDKHIQGKREGCDYYNNSGERRDEWRSWQTSFFPFFALQQWVRAAVIVCFRERAGEENAREVLSAFQGAGGMQSCVTGYSICGRKGFSFFPQSSLHPN